MSFISYRLAPATDTLPFIVLTVAADHAYARHPDEVVVALDSNLELGLSSGEARERRDRFGGNQLPRQPPPTRLELLWRQFSNSLVLLLSIAAAVSLAIGELLDAVIILAIVLANAALGYFQEGRANEAARMVRRLLMPHAYAIRDGQTIEVPVEEIVPGEVVLLRAGDVVPADGRLAKAHRLEVDEAVLTGESLPVAKRSDPPCPADTPVADQLTIVFTGTTVSHGSGTMVVTATGANTQVGAIAALAGRTPRVGTPLQARLDRLAAFILKGAGAVCIGLGLLAWAYGEGVGHSLLIGVSLAVAAVPEGLPVAVTVALALGVRSMARHGAIVRRLSAVETLGSTTVICTDKTGTLTEGRLSVTRVYACQTHSDHAIDAEAAAEVGPVLSAALIASEEVAAGEPDRQPPGAVERAISAAAKQLSITTTEALAGRRLVTAEPFDSVRKRISVVVESTPTQVRASYVKGAPDVIAPTLRSGGEAVIEAARRWATEGMRVLLVACRDPLPAGADPEAELTPIGLIGIADPLKASSRPSVEQARKAGVRTVMITGDHPQTALAIARATAISSRASAAVVSAEQIDRASDVELRELSTTTDVYARVTPSQKLRIVEALKANGEIVAMTGDGVNDVPALQAAHVGVAMGQRGTAAAVEAADMVLADDDYSTIVRAIRSGRVIYDNILSFVLFLLSANAGEVLVFLLAIAGGLAAPLTVLQILMVNLLTDGLPALALASDPPEESALRRGPRPASQQLLDPIRARLGLGGLVVGLASFAAYLAGLEVNHATAQTMAFTTLVFAQLVYVFSVRTSDWLTHKRWNPSLVGAVVLSATIAVVILAVPAIASRFDAVPITGANLAAALGLALLPTVVVELYKARSRRRAHSCS